ncbi:MAG: hypothetical protein M5U33_12305 [Pseudorhodoplanes sp.]|nr:hypothetical protein [Pseudorhodoplanes sp.]
MDDEGAGHGNRSADAEGQPAARGKIAAQMRALAALGVLRDETLGGGGEPDIDERADQHHPGPDIDENAELAAAHPAREQDLQCIGKARAADADGESRPGHALGDRAVGAVGEPGAQARRERGKRPPRHVRLPGIRQSQRSLPGVCRRAARRSASGRPPTSLRRRRQI